MLFCYFFLAISFSFFMSAYPYFFFSRFFGPIWRVICFPKSKPPFVASMFVIPIRPWSLRDPAAAILETISSATWWPPYLLFPWLFLLSTWTATFVVTINAGNVYLVSSKGDTVSMIEKELGSNVYPRNILNSIL